MSRTPGTDGDMLAAATLVLPLVTGCPGVLAGARGGPSGEGDAFVPNLLKVKQNQSTPERLGTKPALQACALTGS